MKAAVYSGTRTVYYAMLAALKSLLLHSDVEKIYLLIEDDEFPEKLPDCVETINISKQTYIRKDSPNYNSRWTYMTAIRVAFPYIFPKLDKILSLDCDVIAMQDVPDIWDFPVEGYYLAAAKEPRKSEATGNLYINAGVMLMNLAKLRDGKSDEMIRSLNTKHYEFTEQDCISENCKDGILEIPSDYNVNSYTEKPKTVKMLHYAAVRNWQGAPLFGEYLRRPWEEIMANRI